MSRTHTFLCLAALLVLVGGCGYQSGQSAVQEGMAAFKENNFPKAIACFTRATKRITDSPDLYYNLGLAHFREGNLEPAQDAFNAALELKRDHGESLACLGQIAFLQNDLPKAQSNLEQALAAVSSDESKARVLTALALTESARERYDIARLRFLQAIKIDRRYAPAYYNLASLYRDKFNLREEALDNFDIFGQLVDKKDAHYEKAMKKAKQLRQNLERTRAEELDSMRRDPSAAAKLLQEGVKQHLAKQYPKAIKSYRDALAADPFTFSAAFGMALIYKAQGQKAEAVEAFKRAAEISPAHQDSYFQAAELALQLKHAAEAAKILDRAIARCPFNPANADLMARIRFEENRRAEARAYGEFYLSLLSPEEKKRAALYEKWVKGLPVK